MVRVNPKNMKSLLETIRGIVVWAAILLAYLVVAGIILNIIGAAFR